MKRATRVAALPFTPNPDANALLAHNGNAFLIAMCLEQQVRSEKAMIGPLVLLQRLGHLDVRRIARMPAQRLDAIFRKSPALHRFPGMMAKRVRALCNVISSEYRGDGATVWLRAKTAEEAYRQFLTLPGFGEAK